MRSDGNGSIGGAKRGGAFAEDQRVCTSGEGTRGKRNVRGEGGLARALSTSIRARGRGGRSWGSGGSAARAGSVPREREEGRGGQLEGDGADRQARPVSG